MVEGLKAMFFAVSLVLMFVLMATMISIEVSMHEVRDTAIWYHYGPPASATSRSCS